jgi:hypothetical protein
MEPEPEDQQPLVHETVSGDAQGPESLFDALRAKRQEIADSREVYLTIPGYEDTNLKVKHTLLERRDIEDIGRRVLRETKNRGERNMRILMDQIIRSTEGFFIAGEDGSYDPLPSMNGDDSAVIGWDQFAEGLGEHFDTARQAVFYAFGNNEFAIADYGVKLNRWV